RGVGVLRGRRGALPGAGPGVRHRADTGHAPLAASPGSCPSGNGSGQDARTSCLQVTENIGFEWLRVWLASCSAHQRSKRSTEEDTMHKVFATLVGFVAAAAALLPTVVEAGVRLANH